MSSQPTRPPARILLEWPSLIMARNLFRLVSSMGCSSNFVSLEHFKGQQLEDAVNCSQKLASLKPLENDDVSAPFSVTNEETRRLGEATDNVVELLEEMKRAICGVKEMKQRVRNRKDNNINVTREMFTTLRKAIDEREEQTIADIKEEAYRRERALEVTCLVVFSTYASNWLCIIKWVEHSYATNLLPRFKVVIAS